MLFNDASFTYSLMVEGFDVQGASPVRTLPL
jgi:hypothetical protein